MDGQLYVCMYDGWTFQTGFIRSTLSKSRPKNILLPLILPLFGLVLLSCILRVTPW